jgi:hypothetical protein
MRTIRLKTTLPTTAERVWPAMLSPATFLYACKGLFGVPALAGRTETWHFTKAKVEPRGSSPST